MINTTYTVCRASISRPFVRCKEAAFDLHYGSFRARDKYKKEVLAFCLSCKLASPSSVCIQAKCLGVPARKKKDFERKKVGGHSLREDWKGGRRQCSGSVTFCNGSGSSDPYLWQTDPDADPALDPALFVNDLQDDHKKYFFMLIPFWMYIYIILQR
jgi:hypothetical protein